jgi:phosphoglycolate phosphatase
MLVLFDLDGTLTDPFDGISRSVAHALERMGLPGLTPQQQRSFIGPPLHDSFAALGLDERQCARAVTHYREYYSGTGIFENVVYDGVPRLLEELSRRRVRLAVATSKPTVFAERVLAHVDLAKHFELVSGATMDGSRSRKGDIIGAALTDLGHDPRGIVMAGDRMHDVLGASECGVRSIGVRWGYAEPGELEAAGADQVVDSPADLLAALLALVPAG